MTYFSLHVILNAVKNPTEELTGHILLTLVVGYFATAQYDGKSPIGTSCLAMTTKKRFSLALNMTRKSGAIRLRIAPLNTARIIACYSCFAGVPQYGHTPSLSE